MVVGSTNPKITDFELCRNNAQDNQIFLIENKGYECHLLQTL